MNLPARNIDVKDLLIELGFQKVKESGENVMASCPFHKDNHPSFGVHKDNLMWNCFSCKRAGTLAELISAVADKSIQFCTKYIVRFVARTVFRPKFEVERKIISDVPERHRYHSPQLLEKGFLKEALEHWSVGYDPESKAAVIYWRDRQGNLVGYEYKYFKDSFRFRKEVDTGSFLYGEDKVIGNSIIVIESPLDCIWAFQNNLFNVVAVGGHVSNMQISLLKRYKKIIIWMDNDEAGIFASRKIYKDLNKTNQLFTVDYIVKKKDLGEMTLDEIWKCYRTKHLVEMGRIKELCLQLA